MKNFFKIISVVLMILFFAPSFLVSCSGEEVGSYSAAQAAMGISVDMYGTGNKTQITDPHMLLLLILFIPLVILITWCTSLDSKLRAGITIAAAAVDLYVWNNARSEAQMLARKNNCDMEPQAGFYLSQILLITLIVFAVLVIIHVFIDETYPDAFVGNNGFGADIRNENSFISPNQKSNKSNNENVNNDIVIDAHVKYCPKCGKKMESDAVFCPKCGNKMPEI